MNKQKPKMTPVVKGTVKQKTSALTKIRKLFGPADVEHFKEKVFNDILVPTVKKTLSDAFNMWLYGKPTQTTQKSSSGFFNYGGWGMPYASGGHYDYSAQQKQNAPAAPQNQFFGKTDELHMSEDDANNVYNAMKDCINTYGRCSLLAFHDMCGFPTMPSEDNYGWRSMDGIVIVHDNSDPLTPCAIKTPKPMPLN